MKLTKDDFVLEYPFEDEGNETFPRQKVIEQILKNQEDAEKWREFDKKWGYNVIHFVKNQEIVERLKKRIKECYEWRRKYKEKNYPTDDDRNLLYMQNDIIFELQKILGEENE